MIQGFVDAGIDFRGLVVLQQLLADRVGPLRGIQGAFGLPLLEAVVVGNARVVEGALEVGLGVGAAEEVLAGADSAEGLQGLGEVPRKLLAINGVSSRIVAFQRG